ncbi:MAG: thioredoxin family protein [Epsilonproteobacteria bacterium]|nr:thioredoxin family protein [Campylobacterota bacterium]
MKQLACALFLACEIFAFEWKTLEEAKALQAKTHMPIMIDVVRTNCHYCTDMERDVFEDKAMSAWLEKRFISVKINLDKEPLPFSVKVSMTPTFLFLNEKGEIIKSIPGSWSIEDFQSLTKGIK